MSEVKLKVILLRHTPNPEETVAMAAKLCYSPSDIGALKEKIEAKDQKAFVEKLMKMGHMSPIEHSSFTFALEGISRACSHQLVRHRLASYSQQSQRYVSESSQESGVRSQELTTFDYIIPPVIKEDKELKKYFEAFMAEAQKAYNHIVKRLNEKGIKGEAANQDARFVIPNAAETKIMVTMNARELLHFFRMRCCNRAQWEIRKMADEMLKLVKKASPIIFEKAGPGCLHAPCPEGEYTCGKINEVRKKYGVTKKSPSLHPV
ncbi:MAG: Flavin-dependent thymidylate synthase [Syntrophomonadaceae bacterium]|nr:Flavin-dependent thymidylate synthase [Bacillota bacterium]